jgi:hypothetical protein
MLFAIVVSLSFGFFAMGARFFLIDHDYLSIRVFLIAMVTIGKPI